MANNDALPAEPSKKAQDLAASFGLLQKQLEDMRKSGQGVAVTMKGLDIVYKKNQEELKKTGKGVISLSQVLRTMDASTDAVKDAAGQLSSSFATSMGVMSQAQEASAKKSIEDIELALAAAESGSKDEAVLREKKRRMELSAARESLQTEILKANAAQGSKKYMERVGGSLQGMFAAAKLAKFDSMQKVGTALGLTAQNMKDLSVGAIIATVAGTFLSKTLLGMNKAMGDAALAGLDLSKNAAETANNFKQSTTALEGWGALNGDNLRKYAAVLNTEMGSYMVDSAKDGGLAMLGFVKKIGSAGITFGTSAEEAVRLTTKLGVLSRTGMRGSGIIFENLGDQANSLNVNLEALADPMAQMAELSGAAGAGMMDAVGGFNAIVGAAKGLTSLSGPMFTTMTDASKVGAVKNFISSFSKISDIQWSAFTMKPGQNFFDSVSKVANMTAQDKLGAMNDLAGKLGVDRMKSETQKQFTMGSVLSNGALNGDYKSTLTLGAMSMKARASGESFDAQKATAELIDRRLNARQTTGAYAAAGGDMLPLIADTLGKILDELQKFMGGDFISKKILGMLMGSPQSAAASTPAYGNKAATSGRSSGPVPRAAH